MNGYEWAMGTVTELASRAAHMEQLSPIPTPLPYYVAAAALAAAAAELSPFPKTESWVVVQVVALIRVPQEQQAGPEQFADSPSRRVERVMHIAALQALQAEHGRTEAEAPLHCEAHC